MASTKAFLLYPLLLMPLIANLVVASPKVDEDSKMNTLKISRVEAVKVVVEQEGSVGRKIKGVEYLPLNFTVAVDDSWEGDEVEVFWETNAVYAKSLDELGQRVVFARDGQTNQTVNLEASLIGVYTLRFYTLIEGEKVWVSEEKELVIMRANVAAVKIITFMVFILIGCALCFMGLELDLTIVWNCVKKPIGPAIGLFCQFIIMPCNAYFLGWLFLETSYERLGLLLLGSSPGGANSNFWTAMFHGDVNLSCTMTFLSTLGSFAFTSLWVYLLGRPMIGKDIPIPYMNIAVSLVSFTVPLLLGIAFKRKWPKKALALSKRVSRPFFFVVLIILPATGTWFNQHFFYLCSWRHLVSGVALGFLGYILGAVFATIARQSRAQVIAISLETAIQNAAIGFVVLNLTFESPYSDMGVIPVLSFLFFSTGPIMFVVYAIYLLTQKIRQRMGFSEVPQKELDGGHPEEQPVQEKKMENGEA